MRTDVASGEGDRRTAVIAALKSRPQGVSGEVLAGELGVSRAAIAKHVAALRGLGYEVDSVPGRGYRLRSVPDLPLPYEVAPLLTTRAFATLVGGGVAGSTNDDARALATAGAVTGTVVLASEQTAGRGRLGRTWASPPGGVYLSVVLRPGIAPADAGPLPLVVGLGVADGLERVGVHAGLKWPNDVVVPDAAAGWSGKVAGVLLESLVEGERLSWVVAGVGVNVRRSASPLPGAACVDELTGGHVPLAAVAAAVLDGVATTTERFASEGFGALEDSYAARCVLTGRAVTVRDPSGRLLAQGEARGVDASGRLVVLTGDGPVPVSAGDVTLRG